jgi:hypothetical protein
MSNRTVSRRLRKEIFSKSPICIRCKKPIGLKSATGDHWIDHADVGDAIIGLSHDECNNEASRLSSIYQSHYLTFLKGGKGSFNRLKRHQQNIKSSYLDELIYAVSNTGIQSLLNYGIVPNG